MILVVSKDYWAHTIHPSPLPHIGRGVFESSCQISHVWGGVPKIKGTFGGPDNQDHTVWGSILGYPYFGKLPYQPRKIQSVSWQVPAFKANLGLRVCGCLGPLALQGSGFVDALG